MAREKQQSPLTTAKMFSAKWTERDETILVELLKRKIHELKYDIRDATTPYAKRHLKDKRAEYRTLLFKVEAGEYDPNILANELKTHSQYRDEKIRKKTKKLGRYADAYTDVDFDYEGYFSKTRYFGAALPIVMLLLIILFVGIILSSAFLPIDTLNTIEKPISEALDARVSFGSVAYFRLGSNENDFSMINNGEWPKGAFLYEEQQYTKGERYLDPVSQVPTERVLLYDEAGMIAVDVTILDIIKAVFKTEPFAENRLDPIENLSSMQGPSWYYLKYIRDRKEDLKIRKMEDGKYDNVAIIRTFATYGTIASLILMIVFCFIEIVFCIGRLFSYTSRRLHFIPLLILLCGLITMLMPALLDINAANWTAVSDCFKTYFQTSWTEIVNATENPAPITFNLFFPILLVFPLLISIMPILFKNREAKTIAFVPKGNKPHTYRGQKEPTRPGQPGQRKPRVPQGAPARMAKAGSKPAYDPRVPRR